MKGVKGENPAFPLYVKDWLTDPQLQMADFEIQGMWMKILCLMWKTKPRGELSGTVEELARLVGATMEQILRFIEVGTRLCFCDITVTCHTNVQKCPKNVTVRNRRMWREDKARRMAALRKKRQREKEVKTKKSRSSHKDVTPPLPSPSPSPVTKVTKESIKNKEHSLYLSRLLLKKIQTRNPKFKKPDIDKWAVNIDRLIRLDKRDPNEIKSVIAWCQDNDFWQDNILSTKKLRDQFDQLSMKMKKETDPYGNIW